ncbi:MAG: NAD-dependent epimerase/dehydratase family protein [Rikenellaceae bacterium]|nr:NAD-dependent epimerase/dehydratase family protein [Rikenellaceae bacterium]
MKAGITGASGFIGSRLTHWLSRTEGICLVPFERSFFEDLDRLREFVRACDVVIHLACVNRHPDPQQLYDLNLGITQQLIATLLHQGVTPAVLYSSSIRETEDSLYGRAKLHSRLLLEEWAYRSGAPFTGLVIPNVYGPGAKPYYNSFIATFCDQLIRGQAPVVTEDREIPLLYIDHICQQIIQQITALPRSSYGPVRIDCPPDFRMTVSEILTILRRFHREFTLSGKIEVGNVPHLLNLRTTFFHFIAEK